MNNEINHEGIQMKMRGLTDSELIFIRDDAKAAWLALPNSAKSNLYKWEMCYAANEAVRRGLSVDGF